MIFTMRLIINKDTFSVDRIIFRNSKRAIKLSYDLNNIYMIGITFKIYYESIKDKEQYIIIKLNESDKKLFQEIDAYFLTKIDNYDNLMNYNNLLKIKKHNTYLDDKNDKNICIIMNSIRTSLDGKNRVQVFTI